MGEASDEQDQAVGLPMSGKGADLLHTTLALASADPDALVRVNAIACKPPGNDMTGLLSKIASENSTRRKEYAAALKAAGKTGLLPPPLKLRLTPQEACLPMTRLVVQQLEGLITLGNVPGRLFLGDKAPISKLAGSLLDGGWTYNALLNRVHFVQIDDDHPQLPAEVKPLRLVPTLHPSFVLHKPRFMKAFRKDIVTAMDWFRGHVEFDEPTFVYHPKAEWLEKFLFEDPSAIFAFDVETDGIEATRARMRCIAIGNSKTVAIIGIRPKDMPAEGPIRCPSCVGTGRVLASPDIRCPTCDGTGRPPGEVCPWYTRQELADVLDVIRRWLIDASRMRIGHNANYYDFLNVLSQLGVETAQILDTIILHRLVESELPHDLGFVVRMWGKATRAWKADREGRKLAVDAESDHQLHLYCGKDVKYDFDVTLPLYQATVIRKQDHLIDFDQKTQHVCRGLHLIGMHVNQAERIKVETTLTKRMLKVRKDLCDIVSSDKHNPGSIHQLSALWFDKWGLMPPIKPGDKKKYQTSKGALSTSDDTVRALLRLPGLQDYQKAYLLGIREYRKIAKLLGTYVIKLRPRSEMYKAGWDEDAIDVDYGEEEVNDEILSRVAEYLEEKGYMERGIVWEDGRLRTSYNAHVTTVGRLSSSKPWNAQNCPKWLRRLITPAPGHCFIGCDAAQLHLRIAASLWQIALYLDAFDKGDDPHSMVTALAIFGDKFRNAQGWPCEANGWEWEGDAYKMRTIAKIIQYASIYRAGDNTVWEVFTSTENKKGELIYLGYSQDEVAHMKAKWLAGVPEVPKGWALEEALFSKNGFVADPVIGRRRDFLDGASPQDLANGRVLMTETALVNRAMHKVVEQIPFFKWGPGTGLLTQTHDAMVIEAPADGLYQEGKVWKATKGTPAWHAWHVLHEAFNYDEPALPGVHLEGKPTIAFSWAATG